VFSRSVYLLVTTGRSTKTDEPIKILLGDMDFGRPKVPSMEERIFPREGPIWGGLLPADCKVNGIMWRDERVEMSLGVWTRGAPGNDVSDDNAHWRHLANTLN